MKYKTGKAEWHLSYYISYWGIQHDLKSDVERSFPFTTWSNKFSKVPRGRRCDLELLYVKGIQINSRLIEASAHFARTDILVSIFQKQFALAEIFHTSINNSVLLGSLYSLWLQLTHRIKLLCINHAQQIFYSCHMLYMTPAKSSAQRTVKNILNLRKRTVLGEYLGLCYIAHL